MRELYILASDISDTTKIKDCKFYKKEQISVESDKVVRIKIPDNIKMVKEKDHKVIREKTDIKIKDCEFDALYKFDGKWQIRNDLGLPLLKGQNELVENEGYHYSAHGFIKKGEIRYVLQ